MMRASQPWRRRPTLRSACADPGRAAVACRQRWRARAWPRRPADQRGLTLAELLVALTLGLLLALLGTLLLTFANDSYAAQVEVARLDDAGRYALETIGRAVRQSAYVNWDSEDGAPLVDDTLSANIGGLDAHSIGRDSDGIDAPLADVANGSDVLALRFAGVGSGPNGDGSVLNCAGFGVPAPASPEARGWSIFYIARSADGEAELRCKYRGGDDWAADAIVRGVDSFQVVYGLDTDTPPDGLANRYVSASQIAALDAGLVLNGADAAARRRDLNRKTFWKRVASVQVALLLHGAERSRSDAEPLRFELFGRAYSEASGGADRGVRIAESALPAAQRQRVRQLFSATVVLRNPSP